MTWLGVGSVEAALWRADPGNGPRTSSLVLRNGVVGLHYAPLHAETLDVRRGDTLVLTTDGIRGGFAVDVGQAPQRTADGILAQYSKGTDDALVLVARYVGNGA
jgi:negative regulator of sigma-B (phosphoserine phosphatase)